MDRKERQYRLAITSNAICDFRIQCYPRCHRKGCKAKVGWGSFQAGNGLAFSAPCKASELFKAWSEKVLPEARDEYLRTMNPKNLVEKFENGILEIDLDYWRNDPSGGEICVRQSIYLSRDEFSGDIDGHDSGKKHNRTASEAKGPDQGPPGCPDAGQACQ